MQWHLEPSRIRGQKLTAWQAGGATRVCSQDPHEREAHSATVQPQSRESSQEPLHRVKKPSAPAATERECTSAPSADAAERERTSARLPVRTLALTLQEVTSLGTRGEGGLLPCVQEQVRGRVRHTRTAHLWNRTRRTLRAGRRLVQTRCDSETRSGRCSHWHITVQRAPNDSFSGYFKMDTVRLAVTFSFSQESTGLPKHYFPVYF